MTSKRELAAAKAQYSHDFSALEGHWEEAPQPEVREVYIASAKIGLAAADEIMFSEEAALRVSKALLVHHISDNAGDTAPEIMAQCESATKAIFELLRRIASE